MKDEIKRDVVMKLKNAIKWHQENDSEFDEGMVNTNYFIGILDKFLTQSKEGGE